MDQGPLPGEKQGFFSETPSQLMYRQLRPRFAPSPVYIISTSVLLNFVGVQYHVTPENLNGP